MTARPERAGASATLVTSYEELRRFALDRRAGPARGVGLALFLKSGMAAWLAVCAPLAAPPERSSRSPRAAPPPVSADLPAELRIEVAMVLTEMALAAHTAQPTGVAP